MALPELSVFEPLTAQSKDDQDLWPEFSLKNVKITSHETGKLTSLLTASGKNLLRVEGVLSGIDPDYHHHLKQRKFRFSKIRIDNVPLYSFSQNEDGSLGFWAAGRAGWYEISSAAARYQSTYAGMIEATSMFYHLADKYRNSRSKLTKESVKVRDAHVRQIMRDYANNDNCKRVDSDDIREGFLEHRYFLMKSMLEGQEDLDWENSPILRYLKRLYPSEFKEIQTLVVGDVPSKMDEEPSPSEESEEPLSKPARNSKTRSQKARNTRTTATTTTTNTTTTTATATSQDDSASASDRPVTPPQRKGKRKSHLRPRSERSSKRFSRYDIRAQPGASTSAAAGDTDMRDANDSDSSNSDSTSSLIAKDHTRTQAHNSLLSAFTNHSITGTSATSSSAAAAAVAAVEAASNIPPAHKAPQPSYYEPRGPGDTWTCPYDGCNERVWDARSEEARGLMRAHFNEAHVGSMQALIESESRPWAGVGHLLQRVKGFAAAAKEREQEEERRRMMEGGGDGGEGVSARVRDRDGGEGKEREKDTRRDKGKGKEGMGPGLGKRVLPERIVRRY